MDTDFSFITVFVQKSQPTLCDKMSERLKEIQLEIASLKKNLEELRRLKSDYEQAKKLRKKLVRIGCD